MDHDRSGSISPDEMRKYLASTNIPPEAIDALILKMDKDGDGSITRQEFALGFGELVTGRLDPDSLTSPMDGFSERS